MKVAVIGAGRIGALHATALAGVEEVSDLVVADSEATRASALADRLGCVAADSVEMVWALRPAGVVIASPTTTHPALVHAALDAGVAVLCEKPLTLSLSESAEIADRARSTGTPVIIGFQRRFDAAFRALREDLAGGHHGSTYLVRVRHVDTGPPPPGYLATSGTMFVDLCIHDYDAIRWIADCEVESVSSAGSRLLSGDLEFDRHGDVDTAVSLLHLESGALAIVEAFREAPSGYEARAEVVASLGVGATAPELVGDPRNGGCAGAASFIERFADAFRDEIEAFVAVIAGRLQPMSTADDATKALQIALAAERSYQEQRLVRIDELDGPGAR